MSAYRHPTRFMAVLAGGVSAFALAYTPPAAAQQAAQADQPAAAGTGGLEEIVVTARRKEEKAHTVPVTLQTFTQDAIKDLDIHTVNDFGNATPGFQPGNNSFGNNVHTWLRGVQGVLSYFNGVSTIQQLRRRDPSSMSPTSEKLLKGPQGHLVRHCDERRRDRRRARRPSNNFEGYIEGTVGNNNRTTLDGAVSVPVIEDKVLLRVAGFKTHTDGYIFDIKRGIDIADQNYDMERVILTLRPTDNFSQRFPGRLPGRQSVHHHR